MSWRHRVAGPIMGAKRIIVLDRHRRRIALQFDRAPL
jgi:hypothetical protein